MKTESEMMRPFRVVHDEPKPGTDCLLFRGVDQDGTPCVRRVFITLTGM